MGTLIMHVSLYLHCVNTLTPISTYEDLNCSLMSFIATTHTPTQDIHEHNVYSVYQMHLHIAIIFLYNDIYCYCSVVYFMPYVSYMPYVSLLFVMFS